MTPHQLVTQFEALVQAGADLSLPLNLPSQPLKLPPSGKCCVILSPHPDDECIVGALPLRLLREGGWRVVNVAVTHGSNPARQLARAVELKNACQALGFENVFLAERGLLRISADSRSNDPRLWQLLSRAYAELGQRTAQHRAQAEVYVLRGSLPAAIEQLEIARKGGDGDFYELSAVDARMRELKQRLLEEKRER